MENTKKPAEPNVLKVFLSIIDRVVRVFAIEREQIPIIRTRTSTYTNQVFRFLMQFSENLITVANFGNTW